MKRVLLPYLLAFFFGLIMPVLPASAATPTYSGNHYVPTGATLTFQGSGGGCLLVNSSGQAYIAACPVGTVAFTAAAPFTVTGSGPYVIGCSTCFTTVGGTISGATTISSTLTVTGSTNAAVVSGTQFTVPTEASTAFAYQFQDASAHYIGLGYNCGTVSGVSAVEFNVNVSTLGCFLAMDASGNAGFRGQVSATQFNVISKRSYKTDIQPLSVDALQVLHDTDFAAFRYKKDPRLPHIGIIADDSPSVLSGEKHDHLDIEALATVDAKAILQLETQIQVQNLMVFALIVLVLFLVVALGLCWNDKKAP